MSTILDFFKDNAVITTIGGTIGGILAYLGIRTQKAPNAVDTQAAINMTIEAVAEQYRNLATDMHVEMTSLRAEIIVLRKQVDDYATKLEAAENEIQDMDMHIGELTTLMMSHGITPPQRRRRGNVG